MSLYFIYDFYILLSDKVNACIIGGKLLTNPPKMRQIITTNLIILNLLRVPNATYYRSDTVLSSLCTKVVHMYRTGDFMY